MSKEGIRTNFCNPGEAHYHIQFVYFILEKWIVTKILLFSLHPSCSWFRTRDPHHYRHNTRGGASKWLAIIAIQLVPGLLMALCALCTVPQPFGLEILFAKFATENICWTDRYEHFIRESRRTGWEFKRRDRISECIIWLRWRLNWLTDLMISSTLAFTQLKADIGGYFFRVFFLFSPDWFSRQWFLFIFACCFIFNNKN